MMRSVLLTVVAADFLPGSVAPTRHLGAEADLSMSCKGEQRSTQKCNTEQCEKSLTCTPTDGEWDDWSEWSACSCSGVKEKHRSIQVHATCGGRQVEGAEITADFCAPTCKKQEPVMCEFSDWGEWATCDRKCGGGQRNRQRVITQQPENCGEPCGGETAETSPCNMHDCNEFKPCEVSDWSEWGKCPVTCGGSQQARTREVVQEAVGNAEGCNNVLSEIKSCAEACCDGRQKRDCVWGEWSDWGDCSSTCGSGHRSRDRVIFQSRIHFGDPCLAEGQEGFPVLWTEECATNPCTEVAPQDGDWNDWNDWSECSVTCGDGHKYRQRTMLIEAGEGGTPAIGDMQEYDACITQSCSDDSVDCNLGDWSDWGSCSVTEGMGSQARTRAIVEYAQKGGKACDSALGEVTSCGKAIATNIPTDCEMDDWAGWGACTVTCGGGTRINSREVIMLESNGGRKCADYATEKVEPCNVESCGPCDDDVDCKWSEWEEWSACTQSCSGGQKQRFRTIDSPALNYGGPCETHDSMQVKACNTFVCGEALYCVWDNWDEWSECSATCGSGTQEQVRSLIVTDSPNERTPLDTAVFFDATIEAPDNTKLYYDSLHKADTSLTNSVLTSVGSMVGGFAIVMAGAALLGQRRSAYAVVSPE